MTRRTRINANRQFLPPMNFVTSTMILWAMFMYTAMAMAMNPREYVLQLLLSTLPGLAVTRYSPINVLP